MRNYAFGIRDSRLAVIQAKCLGDVDMQVI